MTLSLARRIYQKFKIIFSSSSGSKIETPWPQAKVTPGAIIEGVPQRIELGAGTVIEAGALLSLKGGGRIILGQNCIVHRGAMLISYGGEIVLGDNCSVNPYTVLYGHGGLKIGDWVRFAAHSVVIPANHTYDDPDTPIYKQPLTMEGIEIGNDVWIGAGVRILDGVKIGNGAVVGAGAVVAKHLAPFSVSVGVPARTVKTRR